MEILPTASIRYARVLLGGYLLCWVFLAYKPLYPDDWLLENVLVFLSLPVAVYSHRKIGHSKLALTALFAFMCLHAIGAHYTYAAVPYREWLGLEIDGRNHYDRFVHFLYGLLLMPVYREIFTRMTVLTGLWSFFVPVTFVMAHSEAYEIIEWQAALRFGGDLGQAYLGTQGDIWDAQKDSFAAAIGAVMGWVLYTAALRWGRNRGNQDRAT
ncbi:MAG: DUF2238 domain-containing protein [Arenimonas sp.]